jgi:anti-anti-sigma factor
MDSSGLAILISLKARMNAGTLRVVVVRGGPPVQRPITIAGLDQQFEFVDEPGQAALGL